MYALLTRAPLSKQPKSFLPLDLHVLGLPLAFILSQDQTLHVISFSALLLSLKRIASLFVLYLKSVLPCLF